MKPRKIAVNSHLRHDVEASEKNLLTLAERIYSVRRKRSDMLGEIADLFHDPAWDIILDLYIAAGKGSLLPITSVCIGAAVPSSTALRAINTLQQRGVIVEAIDPDDRRKRYITLSTAFRRKVEMLLAKM